GRPSRSASPGRRLWIKTSASSARRTTMSRPSSLERSSASERLFAFAARNSGLSPPRPQARVSSPTPGRSTLITSAPSAPSSCVQYGPASETVKSTTRTFSSGLTRNYLRGDESARTGDLAVPAPTRRESGRLVRVGRGGARARPRRRQADPALDRLRPPPLGPPDGARRVRGPRGSGGGEPSVPPT